MKCINCGNELPETAKFCNICGTAQKINLEVKEISNTYVPIKKKSKNRMLMVILIIVFVLGICGGFIYKKVVEKEDEKNPPQGEQDPVYDGDLDDNEDELAGDVAENENNDEDVINVEDEVEKIRERYNADVKKIEQGAYSEVVIRDGLTAYVDGSKEELIAIKITKGVDGASYRRFFYFENSRIYFSYYENQDSYRLYFVDGKLIRLRYAKDASASSNAVNYDSSYETEYGEWEERVTDDLMTYMQEVSNCIYDSFDMSCVKSITASSSLTEYNMTHVPERIADGDLATAWVEGANGQGIGEEITLQFDGYRPVSGLKICAGYHKNDELFQKNSRPAKVTVIFSDGVKEEFNLQDIKAEQELVFNRKSIADSVTIKIESVYAGDKYEDTVISELSIY